MFVATTLALAMTAPLESFTVPVSVALTTWACKVGAINKESRSRRTTQDPFCNG